MDPQLAFHLLAHGSPEYRLCLELRRQVLLNPVGVALTPEEIAREARDLHLAAWHDSELVACLILSPCDGQRIRMRQVAVAIPWQGSGIGRLLVLHSEGEARRRGYAAIFAHAREPAVGFYEKLGYRVVGDRFMEVNVPHRNVEKTLAR